VGLLTLKTIGIREDISTSKIKHLSLNTITAAGTPGSGDLVLINTSSMWRRRISVHEGSLICNAVQATRAKQAVRVFKVSYVYDWAAPIGYFKSKDGEFFPVQRL
jgi:hypothetical protein